MEAEANIAMYVTRGCLVAPIQTELHDELVRRVQEQVLKKVYEKRIKGVIIDLSGVTIIDSFLADSIFRTARMASLLGAKTVITGLRPGVVASLVDLNFEPRDVLTGISIEEGFRMLEPLIRTKKDLEEPVEPEPEVEMDQGAEDEEIRGDNRDGE